MQALLTAVLKNLITWVASLVRDWWNRRQEQKQRHAETTEKVEAYKQASDEDAKKTFEGLP